MIKTRTHQGQTISEHNLESRTKIIFRILNCVHCVMFSHYYRQNVHSYNYQ